MNEIPGGLPKHLVWDDKPSAKAPNNALGKDDFMRLLLTQMQNQDPLNPMDHKDFSAQLAQFGALEKLGNIETGIQGMQGGQRKETGMQAMHLIGRRVEAQGQAIDLVPGQGATFRPVAERGLQPLKASIFDLQGQLVRTIDVSALPEGSPVVWDGLTDQGQPAPAGRYTFRVLAKDAEGKAKEIGNEVSGTVTGMEMRGETPLLLVETPSGTQRIEVSRVTSVRADGEKGGTAKGVAAPRSILSQPMSAEPLDSPKPDEETAAEGEGEESLGASPIGMNPWRQFLPKGAFEEEGES